MEQKNAIVKDEEKIKKDITRKKSNSIYYVTRLKDILKANKLTIKKLSIHLGMGEKSQTVYSWFSNDCEPMWFGYAFEIINFLYTNIPTFDAMQFFKDDFKPYQMNKYNEEIKKLSTKYQDLKSKIAQLEKTRNWLVSASGLKLDEDLIKKIKDNEDNKNSQNYNMRKKYFGERLYDDIAHQLDPKYNKNKAHIHVF